MDLSYIHGSSFSAVRWAAAVFCWSDYSSDSMEVLCVSQPEVRLLWKPKRFESWWLSLLELPSVFIKWSVKRPSRHHGNFLQVVFFCNVLSVIWCVMLAWPNLYVRLKITSKWGPGFCSMAMMMLSLVLQPCLCSPRLWHVWVLHPWSFTLCRLYASPRRLYDFTAGCADQTFCGV